MIDPDLIEQMNAAIEKIGGVHRLPNELAEDCVRRLAKAFVTEDVGRWWWESLSVPCKHIGYDDADGLAVLESLVDAADDVVLVITDDEAPPWPVYSGDSKNIVNLLRECRYFEYMLAHRDARWVIFDTHMNELVVAGDLRGVE